MINNLFFQYNCHVLRQSCSARPKYHRYCWSDISYIRVNIPSVKIGKQSSFYNTSVFPYYCYIISHIPLINIKIGLSPYSPAKEKIGKVGYPLGSEEKTFPTSPHISPLAAKVLLALPGTNIAWPGALSARTARRRDRASAPQAGEEMGGFCSDEMVGNYGRNDEKKMGKSLVNNGNKWENHGKSILMLHVWNIDLHLWLDYIGKPKNKPTIK